MNECMKFKQKSFWIGKPMFYLLCSYSAFVCVACVWYILTYCMFPPLHGHYSNKLLCLLFVADYKY